MTSRGRIFIATPAYGGLVDVSYTASLLQLWRSAPQHGWQPELLALKNESLIQRARNNLADQFMKSADPGDRLMFIDADITFPWQAIPTLADTEYDLVGGIYRKKGMNWDKVINALGKGIDPRLVGDYVVDPVRGELKVERNCIPVRYMGTGFMMISHKLMSDMVKNEDPYISDSADSHGHPIPNLFQCPVIDDRLLSEDYYFCQRAIELGYQPMAHIGIRLGHTGSHTFYSDLRTELAIK